MTWLKLFFSLAIQAAREARESVLYDGRHGTFVIQSSVVILFRFRFSRLPGSENQQYYLH